MRRIAGYVKDYARSMPLPLFLTVTVYTGLLVFVNYAFRLNRLLVTAPAAAQYAGWTAVFALAFPGTYLLQQLFNGGSYFQRRGFLPMALAAALLFSWKLSFKLDLPFSVDLVENRYWNGVAYWPLRLLGVTLVLFGIGRLAGSKEKLYGTGRPSSLRPYLVMLLLMVPLVALAATQPDFQQAYPKLKHMPFLGLPGSGWRVLLYELSYGSDFITIELFFRGFLVVAFARFAGRGAVLPMAVFYCTIHFGKPLGECISSFFGGLLLGIVTYHSRNIWGGLVVHLGIAWLMELAGWIMK